MEDRDKSKEQLISELAELRQRLADLEKAQVERHRAEEELERGRRLIFSTLEVLPASICLLAPDYHLRFANQLFRATFGDPEGKACYEVLHDRSSPCKECLPLGVLESGEPLTREWTNPLGRYFMVHYHPFEDEYGAKLVLEMGIDITERKLAEQELLIKERKLSSYFSNASEVIFFLDVEPDNRFRFSSVNQSFLDATGLSENQVVGKDVHEVIPEPSLTLVLEKYKQAILENKTIKWEETTDYPAGRKYGHVSVTPILDMSGRCIQLAGSVHDITEFKLAEEELRKSEETLKALLRSISDTALLVDPEGTIISINETGARRFETTPDDLMGKNIFELFGPEIAAYRIKYFQEVLDTAKPISFSDFRAGIHLESGLFPIFDNNGKVRAIAIFARDVTEHILLEEELQAQSQELEAYAQVVSHDLRGPISVIQGAGFTLDELMERCRDHEVADQAREITELIKKGSRNAEALIESLLGLAKAGQVPIRITEVDVKRTVEAVFEEKSAIIEEKGVRVVMAEDLGLVMAEPTHIYQIFSNLIGNALRYNDNPEPELRISCYKEEDGIHRYLVSDNGPGIRTEDMERIFDPLFKGKGGGTGIGLSIARKIAGIYGGNIKAYNDGGACFEFTIKDFRQKR